MRIQNIEVGGYIWRTDSPHFYDDPDLPQKAGTTVYVPNWGNRKLGKWPIWGNRPREELGKSSLELGKSQIVPDIVEIDIKSSNVTAAFLIYNSMLYHSVCDSNFFLTYNL